MQHSSKIVQIGEAAEMLNLTPSGVRWLIDVGKLPAERTGNGLRILKRSDVESYAAQRDALAHERRSHVA